MTQSGGADRDDGSPWDSSGGPWAQADRPTTRNRIATDPNFFFDNGVFIRLLSGRRQARKRLTPSAPRRLRGHTQTELISLSFRLLLDRTSDTEVRPPTVEWPPCLGTTLALPVSKKPLEPHGKCFSSRSLETLYPHECCNSRAVNGRKEVRNGCGVTNLRTEPYFAGTRRSYFLIFRSRAGREMPRISQV